MRMLGVSADASVILSLVGKEVMSEITGSVVYK